MTNRKWGLAEIAWVAGWLSVPFVAAVLQHDPGTTVFVFLVSVCLAGFGVYYIYKDD